MKLIKKCYVVGEGGNAAHDEINKKMKEPDDLRVVTPADSRRQLGFRGSSEKRYLVIDL